MKYTLLLIICFLYNAPSFAHKDKIIRNNYGNIKTYLRTGFDYSEIFKMEIIGKLSNDLALKLNYKDTLLIEYVHDYTKFYDRDIYSFENNNTNYKFLGGLENHVKTTTNGKGISVRIYAKNVAVEKVLKLVEFSILNRKKLHTLLVSQHIKSNYPEEAYFLDPIPVNLIPDDLFMFITSAKSELITEAMTKRIAIYQQTQYGIEIYWQGNKFIFEYKNIDTPPDFLFDTKDFYYFKEVDLNTMLVFIDGKSFYYLSGGEKTDEKPFELDNESFRPANVIGRFNNKIIISNDYFDSFNIFLKDKRKIISKFE